MHCHKFIGLINLIILIIDTQRTEFCGNFIIFKVSIDEGFIDDTSIVTSTNGQSFHENPPNNDLQIWTDCLASNWQICHSWERLTR